MTDIRVIVTDNGIEVHHSGGPHARIEEWPWPDLARITVYTMEIPPDGDHLVAMDIDTVFGEFGTVHEDAAGFDEALRLIAQRGVTAVPSLDELVRDHGVVIWQAARDETSRDRP